MQRTIEQKGWQVNLPINKLELLRKVRNYERNFALSYGRMPTTDEVAKQMELEPEKSTNCMSSPHHFTRFIPR